MSFFTSICKCYCYDDVNVTHFVFNNRRSCDILCKTSHGILSIEPCFSILPTLKYVKNVPLLARHRSQVILGYWYLYKWVYLAWNMGFLRGFHEQKSLFSDPRTRKTVFNLWPLTKRRGIHKIKNYFCAICYSFDA